MAISILRECFGRRFTSSVTGQETAVRVYLCFASANYTDLDDVVTDAITAGLPDLGDSFSASSSDLIVIKHTPREIEYEQQLYKVEVEYATDDFRYGIITSRPWEVTTSSVLQETVPVNTRYDTTGIAPINEYTVTGAFTLRGVPYAIGDTAYLSSADGTAQAANLTKTDDGNELEVQGNVCPLNAAGLPFDPPPIDYKSLIRINLQKRVAEYSDFGTISSWSELFSYVNTCNDDTETIVEIGGAKYQFWMDNITAINRKENALSYYDVTFSIIFDKDYHYQRILNAGYHDVFGNMITLKNGEPVSQPWPLTQAGVKIEKDAAFRQANSKYYAFGFKEVKDWSKIGLPTTW